MHNKLSRAHVYVCFLIYLVTSSVIANEFISFDTWFYSVELSSVLQIKYSLAT